MESQRGRISYAIYRICSAIESVIKPTDKGGSMPEHLDLEGAIFDMDGTLLDSVNLWADIDRIFLGKRGIDVPADYQHRVSSMTAPETAAYTIRRFSLAEDTVEGLIEEWNEMAEEAYRKTLPLKEGALDYIRYLAGKGTKLALATASFRSYAEMAMERTGVLPYLSALVSGDEVSCGKESPEIYLKAAELLGVEPSRCAVFEDLEAGIRGARDGGFISIAVHEKRPAEASRRLKGLADRYIYSFSEMMEE